MKQRKVPMRMCIETRERFPKQELIRVVKFNDEISIDLTGKKNGRGCYLKKDKKVIENAKKKKTLNRVFECNVDDNIYEELLKIVD